MLPGFCGANKTIRNFLACKCRMLPPRWSRQSLRTVLWMGCKNFIMLPSLLIAIQHYNMMNVAGKDYCNRFVVEKSQIYCFTNTQIDTMSWISVTAHCWVKKQIRTFLRLFPNVWAGHIFPASSPPPPRCLVLCSGFWEWWYTSHYLR